MQLSEIIKRAYNVWGDNSKKRVLIHVSSVDTELAVDRRWATAEEVVVTNQELTHDQVTEILKVATEKAKEFIKVEEPV